MPLIVSIGPINITATRTSVKLQHPTNGTSSVPNSPQQQQQQQQAVNLNFSSPYEQHRDFLIPNEMVREIASYVMPEDIESFSMISRGVYTEALSLLVEHRLLRERYKAFRNLEKAAFCREFFKEPGLHSPVTTNCAPGDSFSNLLTEVLRNHRVAPYIKEIRHEGWLLTWESTTRDPWNEQHKQLHIPYSEEQFFLFKQALSRYVLPANLKKWNKELESGYQGPIISLLLILLPNINSIKFEQCSNLGHQLREVVERINEDCIPGIPILSHLERVNLQYDEYDEYDDDFDPRQIDMLAFLAAMPSLKSLSGRFIRASGGVHDFSCLSPHSSNITELRFEGCNLRREELRDLCQGLKALQKFHYIYEDYDEDLDDIMGPWDWDPAGMCKVLSKYAQASLEVLDLRSELEVAVGPLESLCDFDSLRDLNLSFSLFRKADSLSSETLASQLPESIQRIGLHDVKIKHIRFVESTIREVVHLKAARLPILKEFCFFGYWGLEALDPVKEELRKLCEDAGVELCFLKL